MSEYTYFVDSNIAPAGARRIAVYEDGERKGTIPLGKLTPPDRSQRLYSFGLISDPHVTVDDVSNNNFRFALRYLVADEDVAFILNCGDLIEATVNYKGQYDHVTDPEELEALDEELAEIRAKRSLEYFQKYAEIVTAEARGKRIFAIGGNHEQLFRKRTVDGVTDWHMAKWNETYAGWKPANKDAAGNITGVYTYDVFRPEGTNDVFVLLACYAYTPEQTDTDGKVVPQSNLFPVTKAPDGASGAAPIARGTITEIKELFAQEKAAGNRIFVAQHVPTTWDHDEYVDENGKSNAYYLPRSLFYGTTMFSGHTHYPFEDQKPRETDGYSNPSYKLVNHMRSVHVPGLCDHAQGYIVDVYKNGIHLRGKKFRMVDGDVVSEDVPLGTYWIDI